MTETNKLLRSFVPQEVVALLEKIDATNSTSDSSYQGAKSLLRDGDFNWLERKLIKHAIGKISRRETLGKAMNVVVFNNTNGELRNDEAQWGGRGSIGAMVDAMVDADEQALKMRASMARQQMNESRTGILQQAQINAARQAQSFSPYK